MNQEVTDFIAQIKLPWQVEICSRLREVIHEAIPDVTERIQYGKPHFLKNGKYAAVISTAKGWVSFSIFNAAALEVPEGQFEAGSGERLTTKLAEGKAVDYELLSSLLKQASAAL
ncbi:DUF1801 domain-containing protein [Paenibacillus tritici]|jgi:hypothetical protein|uniref:DUF1801 domain-containing protein n=1 Tax=Paenibacillus tritici TaxID=1873425 RepID=A0ABX2DJ53_9BACL|nr:DUF1801 domain-containing protein [Paenibacillus tritici]NQX44088.1 DUF1801 domain-containing protein [Paenibacillus tritici]QUL57727.1 DUF1801 domain-containing protein [Paenibacillus tritici]